jgi:hypothetical protein
MMTNCAPRIPVATSWHNSKDPNAKAGSWVTSVGTVTCGRRLVISMHAVAALNAANPDGDVLSRKPSVPCRTNSLSLNPVATLPWMLAKTFHSRSLAVVAALAARSSGIAR